MAIAVDDVDLERDRNLVLRAQAGDDLAFASLYSRYHQRLIRFAARRVGNRADAEEIAQEAFARAYRALPDFGAERRFYSWLSVITARLCIDAIRRGWRCEVGVIAEEPFIDPAFDRVERDDDVARITAAMRRLTPRHREVLELREREGWAYQRIADHYQVSLGTVEALLWRARRSLRREYDALASILIGLPFIRRLVGARIGDASTSMAALSTLGTAAVLSLTGPLAGAAMTSAAPVAAVAHVAGVRTSVVATPPVAAGAARTDTKSVVGGSSSAPTAPHAAKVISDVPIAAVGPVQFLTHEQANRAMAEQQTVVQLGPITVGLTPGNLIPDLQSHLLDVKLPQRGQTK